MFQNLSKALSDNAAFQYTLISPEVISFCLLALSIAGMYRGIEIEHPLYFILFLNLIVTFFFTTTNIVIFVSMPFDRFVTLANASCGFSLLFHCSSWCLTSIIRYIYIVHPDLIDKITSSSKRQCLVAVLAAIVFVFCLCIPSFGSAFYLGSIKSYN
jgi:hypothetical protein